MAIANTIIQVKKSGVSGNVPSSLGSGELALNFADHKLFYKNASGGTSYFYGANNGPSFATVSNGTSLIVASTPNDTLTLAAGTGVTVESNSITKTVTISSTGGGGGSSNSFSTILVSGQPDVVANSPTAPLTLVAGSGITLTTDGTSNTITFASTGGFSGGTIANQLVVANTTSSYTNSNNALVVTGSVGIGDSVYVGNRVGFGNTTTSFAYQVYNPTYNSIDTIFG